MRKEIIKTEKYLLLVSDETINDVRPHKGKWHLEQGSIFNQFPDYLTDLQECKLVIAHLPLNNSPELEGVALLPEIEEDDFPLPQFEYDDMDNYIREKHTQEECIGFYDGYNKAKETYKYTEEDLREAISGAWLSCEDNEDSETFTEVFNRIIKSFQQPKYPIAFNCEMEEKDIEDIEKELNIYGHDTGLTENEYREYCKTNNHLKLSKTINSQGKEELLGTWIWE